MNADAWTPAEVLRAALLHSHRHSECEHCDAYERVADAARTIALPVLEEPHFRKHLFWIADRLVNVYGESENVDFVRKLRKLAALIPEEKT